jgi:hypothetical protein
MGKFAVRFLIRNPLVMRGLDPRLSGTACACHAAFSVRRQREYGCAVALHELHVVRAPIPLASFRKRAQHIDPRSIRRRTGSVRATTNIFIKNNGGNA